VLLGVVHAEAADVIAGDKLYREFATRPPFRNAYDEAPGPLGDAARGSQASPKPHLPHLSSLFSPLLFHRLVLWPEQSSTNRQDGALKG